jgi:MFS family permease
MLSYQAIDLGANGIGLGVIATSYALLPVVVSFGLGRRVDRDGPFRYVIAGNLIFAAGIVVALIATNLPLLYVSAAVVGLGQLMTVLAQQAVPAYAKPEHRDRAFGRFTSAAAVGTIVGPLLAGFAASAFADRTGWSEATIGLLVGLLLCVLGLPAALGVRRLALDEDRPPMLGPSRDVVRQIVRTGGMWQALLAGAIVLTAVDLLSAFLPLWANDRGVSIETVGLLLGLRGMSTLASRLGSNRMIRVIGRRAMLVGSLVAAAAGLAVLPLVTLAGAVVVMVVLGVGLGLAQPLTMSWVSIVAAPGTSGAALGIRLAANRVAQATVPAAVAAAAGGSGANGVFWGTATLLFGAFATLLRAPMGDV